MKKLLPRTALAGMLCVAAVFAQDKANGEKVYKAKCASCYGADGKGETAAGKATKARDICSEEVKNESDAAWTDIISKGQEQDAFLRQEGDGRRTKGRHHVPADSL